MVALVVMLNQEITGPVPPCMSSKKKLALPTVSQYSLGISTLPQNGHVPDD